MNNKRPVNLDLASLRYPPMAIASILHRLSGLLIFILLPVMLGFLGYSLRDSQSFTAIRSQMDNPFIKLVFWVFCSAWSYHVIAGTRHMLMDIGLGESLAAGRRSAIVVIALSVITTLILGVWIW